MAKPVNKAAGQQKRRIEIMAKPVNKAASFEKDLPEKLPEGFEPVTSAKLDGWFVVEKGNSIQGFLLDSFMVDGQFGEKRVYKIEVTGGVVRAFNSDSGEFEATNGMLVGLDEKGWLKSLAKIPQNTEIFVKCLGQEETAKKGQSPAWKFLIGAVLI